MSNYLINTYETYETITDILHDIYLGDIEESDIVDFLVYLEDIGDNSYTIFNEFLRIIYSLNDLCINSSDFTNLTNIGFKTPRELIYFDIGGLYSLCNKSDCEGFYSVGNSIDICKLFDLIEPFIKLNDEDKHSAIYVSGTGFYCKSLYELFKESATQNKKITIG